MANSFDYWRSIRKIAEIAGENEGDIEPKIISNDLALVAPFTQVVLTCTVPDGKALVIVRQEGFTYSLATIPPAAGPFNQGSILGWTGTKSGVVRTVMPTSGANSHINQDVVLVFNSQEVAKLTFFDLFHVGGYNATFTAYGWFIQGQKATNFSNRQTIYLNT